MEHYKAISGLALRPGARSQNQPLFFSFFRFRFNSNFRKGVYCISTKG